MSTQERHLMVYASPWVLSETAVQTPFGEELKRLSYCPMGGGVKYSPSTKHSLFTADVHVKGGMMGACSHLCSSPGGSNASHTCFVVLHHYLVTALRQAACGFFTMSQMFLCFSSFVFFFPNPECIWKAELIRDIIFFTRDSCS